MALIDAHQHFWKYSSEEFGWINEAMRDIQRDFLPNDLKALFTENNISGCVAVQARQTEEENIFLLKLADEFDFIKAVVGWVDLMADDVEDKLAYWHQYKNLKGFRHVLQGEENRALMLQPAFKNGISLLRKFNFTYDILIFPDQLKYAFELVKLFPEQKFVIDHLAKPDIKTGEIKAWQKDIETFKHCENVYCKVSGMVTEADWKNHSLETFLPYLNVITETFGTKRIMHGSDWPVCLVAASSYAEVLNIVQNYFSSFTTNEKENIFGDNAGRFYNLF